MTLRCAGRRFTLVRTHNSDAPCRQNGSFPPMQTQHASLWVDVPPHSFFFSFSSHLLFSFCVAPLVGSAFSDVRSAMTGVYGKRGPIMRTTPSVWLANSSRQDYITHCQSDNTGRSTSCISKQHDMQSALKKKKSQMTEDKF